MASLGRSARAGHQPDATVRLDDTPAGVVFTPINVNVAAFESHSRVDQDRYRNERPQNFKPVECRHNIVE